MYTKQLSLTIHGHRVERRRRRQQHARADGFGRGGAATAWAAAALSARARRLPAQLERGQVQGSVAARGRAAAVASRRAARARRGGQVIGRRVMGRRVTAPSDRSEPIVARPQLTSKACGARLSVSEGGRHVARREDDKCASYGSLFIGQSSGTQVETAAKRAGEAGEIRCEIRLGTRSKIRPMERGLLGRPNSHLAGLLMFS